MILNIVIKNEKEMINFGQKLGSLLNAGDVIELIGDIGSGKTTLTKGIAIGLGVIGEVQSPSFMIKKVYPAEKNIFAHYDFYRLNDAGIMINDLEESFNNNHIIAIEWADIIEDILPKDHISIQIIPDSETTRKLKIVASGEKSNKVIERLAK